MKENKNLFMLRLVPVLAPFALTAGCGWIIGMQKAMLEPEDTEVDDGESESDEFDINPSDGDTPTEGTDVPELPATCTTTEDCDDGNPCNGQEECVDRSCRLGIPLTEGAQCTINIVIRGWCQSGVCIPQTCGDTATDPGEECDDGNDDQTDGCRSDCKFSCHFNADCDDEEDCTTDLCQTVSNIRLCQHPPNRDSCDDDDVCTREDRCEAGTCSGGIAIVCNDSKQCTTDSCDPATGCTAEPVELPAACNFGSPCTSGDQCDAAGDCIPANNTCDCPTNDCSAYDSPNPCNGTYACVDSVCVLQPFTQCEIAGDTPCNKNRCVEDGTQPAGFRCEMHNEADGVPCDDYSLCTLDDVCTAGECAGNPELLDCDDQNPCTEDTCAPTSGCVHTPVTGDCSDGLFCTIRKTCVGGECLSDLRPCFDEEEECTVDFCNEVADECIFVPLPDYTACGTDETTCCRDGACVPCATP